MTSIPTDSARLFVLFVAMGFFLFSVAPCHLHSENTRLEELRTRAEGGSPKDQIRLAQAYFNGRGIERNEKLAALWFERAANSGDQQAQRIVGYFYSVGIGVPKDPARAVRWLHRAVSGGSVEAEIDLGLAYLWGFGVRKDETFGVMWLRRAAEKGDNRAKCYMGDLYYFGIGVIQNQQNALHWYEIAAKHDPYAQYRLGSLITEDENRSGEITRGVKLLRKAAHKGLIRAKFMLGWVLTRKPGFSTTRSESESELKGAAGAGFWRASALLAMRAANGIGAQRDSEAAYYWLRVARLQGGEQAEPFTSRYLKELTETLGPARIREIDAQATGWFEQHKTPLEFVYAQEPDHPSFRWGLQVPEPGSHVAVMVPVPNSF